MELTTPAQIERESMTIIERELRARGVALPEENAALIRRVIHTTADFDYAANLRITADAVRRAQAALRGGVIVTDSNMALAGISKPALQKLGCAARCFMAEPFVAEAARERGCTRAVVSMDHAAALFPTDVNITSFAVSDGICFGRGPFCVCKRLVTASWTKCQGNRLSRMEFAVSAEIVL